MHRLGPLAGGGAAKRVAPFAAAALLAFATTLAPPRPADPVGIGVALVVLIVIVVSALAVPWRRLPVWVQVVPALAFFAVIALVRDGAGGSASGFAPLAMLPVFWLALYGTRRQLVVGLACLGATFLVPLLLFGPPLYPLTDWRRGFLWVIIGAIVGLSVQQLVRELEARRHAAQEHARTLGAVAAAVRGLHGPNAREGIVAAVRDITGAAFAMLLEPDGGDLVMTAQAGSAVPAARVRMGSEPSGSALAFTSGERYFVADSRGDPAVSQRLVDALGAVSLLFEPAFRGDRVVGVVVVGWRHEVEAPDDGEGVAIALLATEAAAVLERADLLARLDELARTDGLTGLPNRRTWDEQSSREHARAARSGEILTIALLDLDHFKRFNDAHGHQAGDRLLTTAAAAWRGEIRETDTLARYGGEEFALALPACPLAPAVDVLERLRAAVPQGQTCSVGVAVWDGSESIRGLIERADRALYEAKSAGRHRIKVADEPRGRRWPVS